MFTPAQSPVSHAAAGAWAPALIAGSEASGVAPMPPPMPAPASVANAARLPGLAQGGQPAPTLPTLQQTLSQHMQRHGAPETISFCLAKGSLLAPAERAVMLCCLTWVLQEESTLVQADAMRSYGVVDRAPAVDLHAYRTALGALHEAICECYHTLPGTYGFVQQSVQCASRYDQARDAATRREAINGWLHWQWAALAAVRCDPLMHPTAEAGHRALCVAYALENSPEGGRVLDTLLPQRRNAR